MPVPRAMLETARALELDRGAIHVIGLLRRTGVPVLLLKGASIADELYDDGTLRAYSDVDVLVPGSARGDAARALLADGFTPRLQHGDVGEELHAEEWVHPGRGWAVDLHTQLPGVPSADEDLWPALWRTRRPLDLAGTRADVLGPAGAALHVALHAAHHGRDAGRPLEDLRRALARHPVEVWREADELARVTGSEDAFGAGLMLVDTGRRLVAAEHWPAPTAARVRLRAASAPPAALALDRVLGSGSAPAAMRMLVRELVPSAAFLRHSSSLARRSGRGLAAAYLLRPLVLLARLGPAAAALRSARRGGA